MNPEGMTKLPFWEHIYCCKPVEKISLSNMQTELSTLRKEKLIFLATS
jgi:hypothetical protein